VSRPGLHQVSATVCGEPGLLLLPLTWILLMCEILNLPCFYERHAAARNILSESAQQALNCMIEIMCRTEVAQCSRASLQCMVSAAATDQNSRDTPYGAPHIFETTTAKLTARRKQIPSAKTNRSPLYFSFPLNKSTGKQGLH
jgi:hypothetical protein